MHAERGFAASVHHADQVGTSLSLAALGSLQGFGNLSSNAASSDISAYLYGKHEVICKQSSLVA